MRRVFVFFGGGVGKQQAGRRLLLLGLQFCQPVDDMINDHNVSPFLCDYQGIYISDELPTKRVSVRPPVPLPACHSFSSVQSS